MRTPVLMMGVAALVLAQVPPARPQRVRDFTGTITDDQCALGDHSRMRMGPTSGECSAACVALHGAQYVLTDGTNVYTLSDQKTPETFAGKPVRVRGTLQGTTLVIQAMTAAK